MSNMRLNPDTYNRKAIFSVGVMGIGTSLFYFAGTRALNVSTPSDVDLFMLINLYSSSEIAGSAVKNEVFPIATFAVRSIRNVPHYFSEISSLVKSKIMKNEFSTALSLY